MKFEHFRSRVRLLTEKMTFYAKFNIDVHVSYYDERLKLAFWVVQVMVWHTAYISALTPDAIN